LVILLQSFTIATSFFQSKSDEDYKPFVFVSQDFFILDTLLKHHPDPVQFPALLSEYEPHLSYESRVKKLRLSMSNIDKVIRKYTKKRALIFSKNKNDKRIKQVSLSK